MRMGLWAPTGRLAASTVEAAIAAMSDFVVMLGEPPGMTDYGGQR